MSSSNKKSNNNAIVTDSKTNQKQKNGIEPFVKKMSNIVSNTKCESGVRKNLRNDGNVKVNKNETNTLSRPSYSLEDLQSRTNHAKLLKSSVNNAQMSISQEVYTDYILKLMRIFLHFLQLRSIVILKLILLSPHRPLQGKMKRICHHLTIILPFPRWRLMSQKI